MLISESKRKASNRKKIQMKVASIQCRHEGTTRTMIVVRRLRQLAIWGNGGSRRRTQDGVTQNWTSNYLLWKSLYQWKRLFAAVPYR
eukprot:scaffold29690_cov59-Attheya_sp.AAC.6